MPVKVNQRTFSRRIPVAFPQFLCDEFLEGVFLYGDATTPCDIMSFPTTFPHSFADVGILMMSPIAHVIAADKVKSPLPK
jgi:hypothetical protein